MARGNAHPSAGIIDSQSVRTTAVGGHSPALTFSEPADQVRRLPSSLVLLPGPLQYCAPLRLPLRSYPLRRCATYRARCSQSTHTDGTRRVSLLGRRRLSPVPTMAVPTFHALYAAGFFEAASPSASPLPWPSSMTPDSAPSCLRSLRSGVSRRGRLRFMLRTAGLHLPCWKARPRASTPRSPQTPAGYYKGALVPPLTGLPPASHRELQDARS